MTTATYDLVLSGGNLLDPAQGINDEPRDIAFKDGKVAAVADHIDPAAAAQAIDASGKLITPGEVAWALCAGADFVVSARGFMFALGCIQALQCNRNTCPTGITTHDRKLQRGLDPEDKAERVRRYAQAMVKEVGVIAHSCGVPEPRRLKRFHCRVVQQDGRSVPLDELYPDQRPG